jgi:hypothetical protein
MYGASTMWDISRQLAALQFQLAMEQHVIRRKRLHEL